MNILIVGDICGKEGRAEAQKWIPILHDEYNIDMVIANGENSAGGVGITKKVLDELFSIQIDVVTSGNHIWDKKEIFSFIDSEDYLIRPANYPPDTPGKGYCVFECKGKKVGVINLLGRTFMPAMDCPFRKADEIIGAIQKDCDYIILDFHAETTSEKMAMGWYLDGRVSCVVGTHTHIQTADERILPQGTGYITDLGMVGPWDSILGVDKDLILKKFLTGLPVKFELAKGSKVFSAIIIHINECNCKVEKIFRILEKDLLKKIEKM